MLDKFEYYHGAAIVRLMEDERCQAVKKHGLLGYVVNSDTFIFLKYTTKARTPWGFTFDQEDIGRCLKMEQEYKRVLVGLVCGGDGICALNWGEAKDLLGGQLGRIATERKHNHSYSVWGTVAELKRKVSVSRWPSIVFEPGHEMRDN